MQVNLIQNNNEVVLVDSNRQIIITNNNCNSNVTVTQPVTNVLEVKTQGPIGNTGPQGPSGSQGQSGSSQPFSYKDGTTWFTTSSIEITGSLTISSSNTFKNIGPAIFSGSVSTSGSVFIDGNLVITGTASFYSSSIVYSSGSTKFGDTLDDTHQFTGSVLVTGSLNSPAITGSLTGSITGSLLGTASYASQANTASYVVLAQSASFVQQAVSSSYASSSTTSITASYLNPLTQSVFVTGSIDITGSIKALITGSDVISLVNSSTPLTNQRLVRIGQHTSYMDLGSFVGAESLPAIYFNKATPSGVNYTLAGDSTFTLLNGVSNLYFRINNSDIISISSTLVDIKKNTTISGSALISGSFNVTGSFRALVTGSDLVNIGNASTTNQRLVRIGQHTSTIDLGSINGSETIPAIWFNSATPSLSDAAVWGTTTTTVLNGVQNLNLRINNATKVAITSTTETISNNLVISGSASIQPGTVTGQGIVLRDIVGTATAAGLYMAVTPSSTNYTIYRDAATTLLNGTDNIDIRNSGTSGLNIRRGGYTSGARDGFTFTHGNNTTQSAGTEISGFLFNTYSRHWTASSQIPLQREFYIQGPTYSFSDTGSLFTSSYNLYVNAPFMGTGATSSANYALGVNGNLHVIGNISQTGSQNFSGSFNTTGSLKVFATGSDFVNLGNASTTGQRIVRIGQHTGWVDIGSLVNAESYGAIYFDQTAPSVSNYALIGSGNETMLNSSTSLYLRIGNISKAIFTSPGIVLTNLNNPQSSGTATGFTYTASSNTGQTLSTEIPGAIWNMGSRQWNTGGITVQREFLILGPTYSFASGNNTFSNSYNLYVFPPLMGTGATSSANWAAGFEGDVRILGSNPLFQLGTAGGGNLSMRNDSFSFNRNVNTGTIYSSGGHAYQWQHTLSTDGTLDFLKLQNYLPAGSTCTTSSIGINGFGELLFIPGNTTSRSASIEYQSARFNTFTRQWNNGNITIQRERLFTAPTYSFTGNSTITSSYNVYIIAPNLSTGATASRNFAAGFEGNVDIIGNIYNTGSTIISSSTGYSLTVQGSSSFSGSFEMLVPTASVNFTPYFQILGQGGSLVPLVKVLSGGSGQGAELRVGGDQGAHWFRVLGSSATPITIDSGLGGADRDTYIQFARNSSTRWKIGKASTNNFLLINDATGSTIMSVDYTTGLVSFLSGSTITGSFNITGSSTITGSLLVTGSASLNGNRIATIPEVKFCIQMGHSAYNPGDASTIYYGVINSTPQTSTTWGRVFVPTNCTLIGYDITTYVNGSAGTAETSSIYVRVNNTTDYELTGSIRFDAGTGRAEYHSSGSSLDINAQDFINIKWVTPTWVTNPTSVINSTVLWFKGR